MPGRKLTEADKAIKRDLLDSTDTFIWDCDGVIWSSDVPMKGAKELLNLLHSRGKRLLYVSNNSSKSRASYLGKLAKLGFPANEDSIFSSAYAAAYYIKEIVKLPADKKVYVIGMEGTV
jgi:4-nitrophenyl phosphatase